MNKLSNTDKIIANAFLIAGIVFFTTLNVSYPPTEQNLYSALIGFVLALLTQLKSLVTDSNIKPPMLGMLI